MDFRLCVSRTYFHFCVRKDFRHYFRRIERIMKEKRFILTQERDDFINIINCYYIIDMLYR